MAVESSNGAEPSPEGAESREERIARQRRGLPDSPGVYLFYGRDEELLYVGKARSIRKRVASHFSGGEPRLTSRIERIETLVTSTEAEALLTEQSFIKRHRPRFNIRLRDDKSYPYVAVSLDEDYPRVYFTREKHRSGRAYFGPFSSAKRVRETLDLLGKLFQFRTCEGPEPGRRSGSPCLDYYIKRCGAPCVGYVSREEYRRNIDAIVDFLSGRYRQVEREEQEAMDAASEGEEFERAAIHRDRLKAIRSLFERQRVASESVGTADLIGVAVEGADANAQVFQVRDGILAERQSFYLENEGERELAEVAEEFVGQYYAASPAMPRRVIVGSYLRERAPVIAEALSERRGTPVEVRAAERGDNRRLRELAERNAQLALDQDRLRREHRRARRVESLTSLAEALGMEELPVRIEGFDISNIGGEHTVASMVVFEGGATKKSDYRRFKVRGDMRRRGEDGGGNGGPDDFASMEEVLGRRLNRYLEQNDLSPHDGKRDESFASLPSLILIDGGKGQLGAGMRALQPFVERGVTVASLAKREEEVYVPGRSEPLELPAESEGNRLLQRVRDEAHRFAIDHHRGRRDQAMTASVLDELKGIGPARKRALLKYFGTPERFLAASREELEAVPGLPGKVGREIHEQLHRIG
ncbi:MAG TPA: excinuclease ABC subunit UvrC [Solirubrobacterales bacterium]